MSFALEGILAVDVGNSRVKLGWFPTGGACTKPAPPSELAIAAPALPKPSEMVRIAHRDRDPREWLAEVDVWIDDALPAASVRSVVAAVHRAAGQIVVERLRLRGGQVEEIRPSVVPIAVRVDEPARVGVDRLLGAVAANRLREAHRPAITIDMGTATTVNLIDPDGAFAGGAILAGAPLSLAALHAAASTLPVVGVEALADDPLPLGKSTVAALTSGAYWGAVGAVNEIVSRLASGCASEPQLFLTGGGSPAFADHLRLGSRPATVTPHLVLAGIFLSADAVLAP